MSKVPKNVLVNAKMCQTDPVSLLMIYRILASIGKSLGEAVAANSRD